MLDELVDSVLASNSSADERPLSLTSFIIPPTQLAALEKLSGDCSFFSRLLELFDSYFRITFRLERKFLDQEYQCKYRFISRIFFISTTIFTKSC
jgi:hypothetical protein